MIINKTIVSKIPQTYIYMTGTLDINSKYLTEKVDDGVKASKINYTTNVKGKHTEWQFFNNDEQFLALIFQMIDHLESLNINLEKFHLSDAWGLAEDFGGYTKKHNHGSCYLSGIVYLNDHSQKLYFPEIDQEITPKEGGFTIFSSFLMHQTKRNLEHKSKYAISFNLARSGFSNTLIKN